MIAEVALDKIRLRDARGEVGLTQRGLARLAHVHWQVIGKCERGGSIRITSAYAILKALNARRALENLPPLTLKSLTWEIQGEEDE